jgi:hypothetical protein
VHATLIKDSRAAERDIVNVTLRAGRFFIFQAGSFFSQFIRQRMGASC